MSKTEREIYYGQQLNRVWAFKGYKQYEGAYWDWHILPFADDHARRRPTLLSAWQVWPGSPSSATSRFGFRYSPDRITKRVVGKRILEVGAAMGAGYAFLKGSGMIDLSRFTGFEISDMGHQRCKETYPEARWVQGDFTRHDLTERFDYTYERHAVHHMPSPVEQYEKMARQTDLAMNCVFVGRMSGETVSDLNRAAYRYPDQGVYYFNIINVFDVVRVALRTGFNHIRVCFYGDHEACSTDPQAEQYLAADIQAAGVQRFMIRMAKVPQWRRPVIYGFPFRPGLWRSPRLRQLREGLARLEASA